MTYDEAWKCEDPKLKKEWMALMKEFKLCKESKTSYQNGDILSQGEDAV